MAAGAVDVPLEYVRLGLRFDRLEPGFVDAYTGDPRLRAAVADEPGPTPQQLRDQARSLIAELDSTPLPQARAAYLRGQADALGLPIIDTTAVTPDEVADELYALACTASEWGGG